MSHFTCAVITDGTKTVEELMAPYQDNSMETVPREFLEFVDETDMYLEEYESEPLVYYHEPGEASLYWKYDDKFKNPDRFAKHAYIYPSRYAKVEIPRSIVFPSFEEYMRDYCGMEPENGRYGYWENPNARWDWYDEYESPCWVDHHVGKVPVRLDEIAFDPDRRERNAMEFLFQNPDDEAHGLERYWAMRGMTDEQYLESSRHLSYWACVTPDGKWHEAAEMYAFGISEEVSRDAQYKWRVEFRERFIDPYEGWYKLHVLDCHI